MIKLLVFGVWICAITLVSSYAAATWKAGGPKAGGEEGPMEGLNYEKTEVINVPMIADNDVKGYVVAQFVYTADAKTLKKLSVPPQPFILDEAFRAIYSDHKIDFSHLDRYDLDGLKKTIVQNVNARFGANIVEDMLVEQFTYVSKEEVRAQSGGGGGPVLHAESAVEK
jgi:hypothetical protein